MRAAVTANPVQFSVRLRALRAGRSSRRRAAAAEAGFRLPLLFVNKPKPAHGRAGRRAAPRPFPIRESDDDNANTQPAAALSRTLRPRARARARAPRGARAANRPAADTDHLAQPRG